MIALDYQVKMNIVFYICSLLDPLKMTVKGFLESQTLKDRAKEITETKF